MGLGIFRFENCLIECSWMASHIPIVMVISMYNFHWCCWRRAMHRSYLHVWFDGGVLELVMAICEFYELACLCGVRVDWGLAVVRCSYYT